MALARDWPATVPYLFRNQYRWREADTMTGTSPASSSATPGPIIAVHNNTVAHRYEITVGDEVAGYAEYVMSDRIVFPHTVIDTAFEGQGLAGCQSSTATSTQQRSASDSEGKPLLAANGRHAVAIDQIAHAPARHSAVLHFAPG